MGSFDTLRFLCGAVFVSDVLKFYCRRAARRRLNSLRARSSAKRKFFLRWVRQFYWTSSWTTGRLSTWKTTSGFLLLGRCKLYCLTLNTECVARISVSKLRWLRPPSLLLPPPLRVLLPSLLPFLPPSPPPLSFSLFFWCAPLHCIVLLVWPLSADWLG